MVPSVLKTMEDSQLQFIDKVVDVLVVQVAQVLRCWLWSWQTAPTVAAR